MSLHVASHACILICSACRCGHYVDVVGKVCAVAGRISLQAARVQPIRDHNAVTTHLLDIIYAHLLRTRPHPLGEPM